MLCAREEKDLVSVRGKRVHSQQKLIDALEMELASIRQEKAKLSQREAAIQRTLAAYTGGEVPAIRATKEMNTVDMPRTVIRNAAVL